MRAPSALSPAELVVGVEQRPDERGPDDHGVGVGGHLGGLVAVRDAQPHSHRQVGDFARPLHQRAGELGRRGARAGHPHDGGRVDEAAARLRGVAQPLVGRRGRDQEDLVEVVGVRCRDPLVGGVGSEVGRDQARSPGTREVGGEPLDAVLLDRVPVGHHHRRRAGRGHGLHRPEDVLGADPALERALRGRLDRRAVHDRIAVGQADLDHVTPAVDHHPERVDCAGDVGEPCRQVADQSGAPLGTGPLERTSCAHVRVTSHPRRSAPRWPVRAYRRRSPGPARTTRWPCPCPCRRDPRG